MSGVGIIARADNRGLGHLTWEACRALDPDRVLVVVPPPDEPGFEQHFDRFPGALIVPWSRDFELDEISVRGWLDGLDVCYSAETPYDPRLPRWCADAGVRLVLHAMPEFFRPEWAASYPGVEVWNPTEWRHETLPADARVVGVPVPLDRWPTPAPLRDELPTFVHIVGKRTAGDRNGTIVLARALRHVSVPMRMRFVVQSSVFPRLGRVGPSVIVETVRDVGDYWSMYDDADVLVLPRRYGGLSLPVQEAAGAGLALVTSDVAPNRGTWPIVGVPARARTTLRTPGGDVTSYETDVRRLAHTLDVLAGDVGYRHEQQRAARAWAESHSWASELETWRRLLG